MLPDCLGEAGNAVEHEEPDPEREVVVARPVFPEERVPAGAIHEVVHLPVERDESGVVTELLERIELAEELVKLEGVVGPNRSAARPAAKPSSSARTSEISAR